jgi:hypothetical protein
VIVPLTRGSTTICRSSIAPIARDTASTSALTKLRVTGVFDFSAGLWPMLLVRAAGPSWAACCAAAG